MTQPKTIANVLEDFDISLTEDELIARGVPEATVERLVTSSAATLTAYIKERKWSFDVFYTAVHARKLEYAKRKGADPGVATAAAATKTSVRKRTKPISINDDQQ